MILDAQESQEEPSPAPELRQDPARASAHPRSLRHRAARSYEFWLLSRLIPPSHRDEFRRKQKQFLATSDLKPILRDGDPLRLKDSELATKVSIRRSSHPRICVRTMSIAGSRTILHPSIATRAR